MGLKTTNYEVKRTGQVLTNAYARIARIQLFESGRGTARLFIQSTRGNLDKGLDPIDYKDIQFKWDRKQDIATCIYEAAKLKKIRQEQSDEFDENGLPKLVDVVVDEQFFGWENDIVNY
jgi:hypothetical protein